MNQNPPRKPASPATMGQAKAIYDQVIELHPLLDLLNEPEPAEGGPIDQLLQSLESVLVGQRHLLMMMEDLQKDVSELKRSRR